MPASERETRHIVLALTEKVSVRRLWQALQDTLGSAAPSNVIAVFVPDDCWERAARLPITREVLLISGAAREFTPQRAREIMQESAMKTRSELESLARERGIRVSFEIVSAHDDHTHLERFVAGASVLLASSDLAGSAIHLAFEQSSCRVMLVESDA